MRSATSRDAVRDNRDEPSERRLLAVGGQPPADDDLRLRLRSFGGRQGRREWWRRRLGLLRRPGRRERRRLRERPRKEALRRRRGLGRELGQLLGQVGRGLEAAREAAAAAHRRRVRRRVERPQVGRGRRRLTLIERRDPVERRRPWQLGAAEEVAAGPAGARRPRRRLILAVQGRQAPAERRDLAVKAVTARVARAQFASETSSSSSSTPWRRT